MDTNYIRTHLQQTVALHESVGHHHSVERFVLDHGREFAVIAPERKFLPWHRRPKSCFSNCLQLSFVEKLVYVEGFAALPAVGFAFDHAWCLNDAGRVLDPTWDKPGTAYFGVPFHPAYASIRYEAQVERGGVIGSLLIIGDDDFALIRGAETRPWQAPG